ncbi:MAG: hypothetical protein IT368_17550 [Candidatus Hydrogenedentes bacterium]|nr:hypothetical protein [Candidatus Hydrogenedentota bacterium]
MKYLVPTLIAAAFAVPVLACIPGPSPSVIVHCHEDHVLRLPATMFLQDLAHLLQVPLPARGAEVKPEGWEPTLEAEQIDLNAALDGSRPYEIVERSDRPFILRLLMGPATRRHTLAKQEVIERYISMRRSMKLAIDGRSAETRFFKEEWMSRSPEPEPWSDRYVKGPSPSVGTYVPDTQLLSLLPDEFRLYFEGANAYRSRNYPGAIATWNTLLALPAAERQYRSTWAEFMLGKVYLETDPAAALAHFENTRSLAADGFHDSLDLAPSSLGWQALAECRIGDYAAAARHYLEQIQAGDQQQQLTATLSLRYVARMALEADRLPPDQLGDPVVQAIMAAAITSDPWRENRFAKWLRHLEAQDIVPLPEVAGHLAWGAYRAGDIEIARKWIVFANNGCPYGTWVKAKLALYDGDLELAQAYLEEVRRARADLEWVLLTNDNYDYGFWMPEQLSAELGAVYLAQGEFAPALESCIEGDIYGDMTYIAEEVMTTEELAEFLTRADVDSLQAPFYRHLSKRIGTAREQLQTILGKRYVRNHNIESAIRTLDQNRARMAREYFTDLVAALDEAPPPEARAQAFIRAGKRLYADGRQFFGATADARASVFSCRLGLVESPWDYRRRHSEDYPPPLQYPPPHAILKATQEEIDRVAAHHVVPLVRDHYEFIAADHMWHAAQLLPDNDPLLAEALFWGGTYIKNRDPKAADKFYKALVNRCWNLPIGAAADLKRWFPEEKKFPPLMANTGQLATAPAEASPLGAWLYSEFGPGLYRKALTVKHLGLDAVASTMNTEPEGPKE